ncbi:MAG: ParB N-terminal domain-containing protein, partial [Ktedonobacteraceae bacterium]|nr:ParB N-terminal domain-containing protein [Ktedonobacteraceae bacterium]
MPQQYYLREVDPKRIKFNPLNPRKHRGTEYIRLKESIERIGIVQPPIVRVLPGNFFEAVDGEGRVSVAQELGFETIVVISVGIVDDQEALMMLQASNTLRSFNLLAECKGLANLYRQGMINSELAKQFGCSESKVATMVAIGCFPAPGLAKIEEHIATSEKQAEVWTYSLLEQMLPLREVLPTTSRPAPGGSPEDRYDYSEVRKAIEKVLSGEITNGEQMRTYVVNRKYEIYQTRFNQELHKKLEEELAAARRELEVANAQQLLDLEQASEQRVQAVQAEQEHTRLQYEGQITILQSQLNDLSKRHADIVKEVAKRPEIVAARERELVEEVEKTRKERLELHSLRQQVRGEAAQAQAEQLQEA